MPQNYLVLIGSRSPSSGASTHGTGFLVFKERDCYVVTCRHVIREAVGGKLFALPKLKKTKNPPGGYPVLILGSPRFHPQDNQTGTYDIAVAQLDVNREFLAAHDIVPIEMTSSHVVSDFREGGEFVAQGYPIDYANTALAENRNEPLLPRHIRGMLRSIPLQDIPQHGFDAPLLEALFAQTNAENRSSKGMSGGIVHGTQTNQVAGMVLASGDFELSVQDQAIEALSGFVFVSADRIREAIDA